MPEEVRLLFELLLNLRGKGKKERTRASAVKWKEEPALSAVKHAGKTRCRPVVQVHLPAQ